MAFDAIVKNNIQAMITRLGLKCSPTELLDALPVVHVIECTECRWVGKDELIKQFILDARGTLPEDIFERVLAAERMLIRMDSTVFAHLRFCAALRLYGVNGTVKFNEEELWAGTYRVFVYKDTPAPLVVKKQVLMLDDQLELQGATVTVDAPYRLAVPKLTKQLLLVDMDAEHLLALLTPELKKCIVYTADSQVKEACDGIQVACRVLTEDSSQRYIPVSSYDTVVFNTRGCKYKVRQLFDRNLQDLVAQEQLPPPLVM